MDKSKVLNEERQIGKRVRAVRKINNLTQEQMAEKMGMNSTTHYQNIENGRNNIGYKHLKCLKQEFGVSSDFILFGEVKNEREYIFNFESLSAHGKVNVIMRIIANLCERDGKVYSNIIKSKLGDK